MVAMETQISCPNCDCSDSTLSVIGNIIGILTFAVAVYASLLYYYRGFRASAVELRDMANKIEMVTLDGENLLPRTVYLKRMTVTDTRANRRLQDAISRLEVNIDEAKRILDPQRSYTALESFRNRAAYVIEKENIVEVHHKLEKSYGDLKEITKEIVSKMTPRASETDRRIMNMVPILEEIRAQNNELRLTMEDVLRRVSALEGPSGVQRATEPREGEED